MTATARPDRHVVSAADWRYGETGESTHPNPTEGANPMTNPTDPPAYDSPDRRGWNRDNHGKTVTLRVPVTFLDVAGDPYSIGYREIPDVPLVTDPDRLGEPVELVAVWCDVDEQIIAATATATDDR